jgi:hypothetical protein
MAWESILKINYEELIDECLRDVLRRAIARQVAWNNRRDVLPTASSRILRKVVELVFPRALLSESASRPKPSTVQLAGYMSFL